MKIATIPRKKRVPATEYEDKCPLLAAMELIGGKWKLPILWHLAEDGDGAEGGVRYNALRRQVRGVTNMMLTKCLRELEAAGLVLRHDFGENPPRVAYELSASGRGLMPILKKLYRWEAKRMSEAKGEKEGKTC